MARTAGIIVAGTHSGAGKTTAALGLIDLFSRKGLAVQPYKAGPDFIDPSLHSSLAGRPSRNLDSFLLDSRTLRYLYHRRAKSADLSIIEGVAGLYDGCSGKDGEGSTAEVSTLLDIPVILVCDVRSSARSIAAVIRGFRDFDPKVRIAGVFLNRLAGPRHLEWCREAIKKNCRLDVLGYLFDSFELEMRERHLGLVPAAERKPEGRWLLALRAQMDRQTDWKRLLRLSSVRAPLARAPFLPASGRPIRIGVARDAAFSFYYEDNLDLLRDLGAKLVPFSPMDDRRLPDRLDGLYLGGGFPEVHAAALERNVSMRRNVASALAQGLPAYAECGGLMYLGRSIAPESGRSFQMAGFLPYRTAMTRKMAMGYVEARVQMDNPLSKKGQEFRGQIFHFSELKPDCALRYAYRLSDGRNDFPDGITRGATLASYLHVHFWTRPALAERFLASCRRGESIR